MNVGLVIWKLMMVTAGVEKIGLQLAESFLTRGHEVTIFFNAQAEKKTIFKIPPTARMIGINKVRTEKDYKRLKNQVSASQVDCILIMHPRPETVPFARVTSNLNIPLISSEHSFPPIIDNILWNSMEHTAFLGASHCIHVSLDSYIPYYPPNLQSRIIAIPNCSPYPKDTIDWESKMKKKNRTILAVGRFDERQKRLSLLIKAFAILSKSFPEWKLVICGSGDADTTEKYANLISSLNITDKVSLPGDVMDVGSYYKEADIFCIPSWYEGLPMVLLEAGSYALPSVGFAHCAGVNEVIIDEESGILVSRMTPKYLAEALSDLMLNPSKRRQMGQAAQKRLDLFEPERVFGAWDRLVTGVINNKDSVDISDNYLKTWSIEQLENAALEILSRPHPFIKDRIQSYIPPQLSLAVKRKSLGHFENMYKELIALNVKRQKSKWFSLASVLKKLFKRKQSTRKPEAS